MATLQHDKIKMQMPDGWSDGTQVVLVGPTDGGFRPNVIISRDPANGRETAKQFADRQLPMLRSALQGFQPVKDAEAKLGRWTGWLREHSFMSNGQRIGQLQFYVIKGTEAYTLTYTHLAAKLVRKHAEELFAKFDLNA